MALIHGGIENLEESVERQNEDLENLENEMDCLFDQLGINDDDCDYDQIEGEELLSLEEEKILLNEIKLIENIRHISYDSPYEYQKIIDSYLLENGFNIENDPILELYSNKEIVEELKYYDEKFGKIKWDKRDYIVIGLTSIIAVAIDFFLVAIPKDMNFKGKDYKGSPLTKYAKEKTVNIYETKDKGMGKWISQLEKYAKVPYDISVNQKDKGIDIPGIRPALHRLMELGHDPILGFVVGVADIIRGGCTVIDKNGVMHFIKYVEGSVDLGEAFLKVFAHLLSDVFTKTGLPCPFMPLIQLCKGETPFILKKNGEKVTFTDLSRYMYANGYDFRHFLTMGTETLFIEFLLHVYFKLAYFEQDIVFLLSFVFHKYVNRSNQLKVSEIY